MLSVVATKIRTSRDQSGLTSTVGRIYEGYLLSEPVVGRGMVIFRDPNGRRMVTTAVRRVLMTSESNVLYVETENSVYRISIACSSTRRATDGRACSRSAPASITPSRRAIARASTCA